MRRMQRGTEKEATAAATAPSAYSSSSSSYAAMRERRRLSGASGYAAILGLSNLDSDSPPRRGLPRRGDEEGGSPSEDDNTASGGTTKTVQNQPIAAASASTRYVCTLQTEGITLCFYHAAALIPEMI